MPGTCFHGARSARSSLLPSLLLGREGLGLRLGERLGDLLRGKGGQEDHGSWWLAIQKLMLGGLLGGLGRGRPCCLSSPQAGLQRTLKAANGSNGGRGEQQGATPGQKGRGSAHAQLFQLISRGLRRRAAARAMTHRVPHAHPKLVQFFFRCVATGRNGAHLLGLWLGLRS